MNNENTNELKNPRPQRQKKLQRKARKRRVACAACVPIIKRGKVKPKRNRQQGRKASPPPKTTAKSKPLPSKKTRPLKAAAKRKL